MKSYSQIELERPEAAAVSAAAPNAGVKTILLHIQNDKSLDSRLETALSLARACQAHVDCLHVTPIEAYVAFDSFGGVFVMNEVISTLMKEEQKLRERVETDLRNEDVAWDYTEVTGNVAAQVIGHAALADLIVTGREPHRADFQGPALGVLGDLLYRSRTPLFIPGEGATPVDPTGTVVIAWDGSFEAANAVRAAIGLLKIAGQVRILQITEDKTEVFPGTRLLKFLSRHDIHAELVVESPPGGNASQQYISGSIIAYAEAANAAYVVMGGYNHSRVAEYVFGGVTRNLLAGCPLPLLIAH